MNINKALLLLNEVHKKNKEEFSKEDVKKYLQDAIVGNLKALKNQKNK